jgi:hypothetical protein
MTTADEKSALREIRKLRSDIASKRERPAFRAIRRGLDAVDPLSFAAYKLRHVRYELKRARGILAGRTYPRYTERQSVAFEASAASREVRPYTFRVIHS